MKIPFFRINNKHEWLSTPHVRQRLAQHIEKSMTQPQTAWGVEGSCLFPCCQCLLYRLSGMPTHSHLSISYCRHQCWGVGSESSFHLLPTVISLLCNLVVSKMFLNTRRKLAPYLTPSQKLSKKLS